MKTIKIFSLFTLMIALGNTSFAQKAVTETIPVAGNCGMCKNNIEKAAKSVNGVKEASWDVDKKELKVTYASNTANAAKIQKSVAAAGYDTRDVRGNDAAYNKLHGCCQYDRMSDESSHAAKADCCKDGKCAKPGHDGKDCCKGEAKKDCCKDDKCSKPGHDGKDCCKKS